jgi:hypothetical protein
MEVSDFPLGTEAVPFNFLGLIAYFPVNLGVRFS